jgi:hypothetical protein
MLARELRAMRLQAAPNDQRAAAIYSLIGTAKLNDL